MDALEAAKRFQSPPKSGDVLRQLLKEGCSDENILKGLGMAAGLLPMPRPRVATA